jgi:hypothetical protein
MLQESFSAPHIANQVEVAVEDALKVGRTVDIKNPDKKTLDTQEMGDLVIEKLVNLLKK